MLTIVVLAIGIGVAGSITFIAICAGIVHEDHSARLGSHAPGRAARLARRITGLRTQQPRPNGTAGECRPRERAGADA